MLELATLKARKMIHAFDLIELADHCHRLESLHSILKWMIEELDCCHRPVESIAEIMAMISDDMEGELDNLERNLTQLIDNNRRSDPSGATPTLGHCSHRPYTGTYTDPYTGTTPLVAPYYTGTHTDSTPINLVWSISSPQSPPHPPVNGSRA